MLLNDQWITEEIRENIKKYLEQMTMKIQWSKNNWHSKSNSKREIYSNTILPQETRKISNKKPNLMSKVTREKRKNKTQS